MATQYTCVLCRSEIPRGDEVWIQNNSGLSEAHHKTTCDSGDTLTRDGRATVYDHAETGWRFRRRDNGNHIDIGYPDHGTELRDGFCNIGVFDPETDIAMPDTAKALIERARAWLKENKEDWQEQGY